MPEKNRSLVLLAFAAIYVIWGSTYLAIRVAVETLPPFLMAGTRFLAAGLPFYLVLLARGQPRPTVRQWRSGLLLGGLMMFGGNGLVTWAEQTVPSAVAAVLITTVPLWMTILDRLFFGGARLSLPTMAGLILGFTGVVVLVSPSSGDMNRLDPVGAALLLVASLSWAIGSLRARTADVPSSPLMGAATQMVGGGLILLAAGTLTGEWGRFEPAGVSTASVLSVLYLVVFGSIVALSAYVYLLRVSTASAVSTYAFVNPVIAVLLGAVIGGEAFGARETVSSALIVGAVAIILLSRRGRVRFRKPRIEPLPDAGDVACPERPRAVTT